MSIDKKPTAATPVDATVRRRTSPEPELPPIQFGLPIEGTHFVRRYQGGREIGPAYVKPICTIEDAEREAAQLGLRAFFYKGGSYVMFDGKWYSWG